MSTFLLKDAAARKCNTPFWPGTKIKLVLSGSRETSSGLEEQRGKADSTLRRHLSKRGEKVLEPKEQGHQLSAARPRK